MVELSDEIANEYDFYKKHFKGGRRKVLKFDYHVFTYINGILQQNEEYPFTENDQIEIKYHVENCGEYSTRFSAQIYLFYNSSRFWHDF